MLDINGRSSTMPLRESMSALEEPISKISSFPTPIFSKASRRNTITVFDSAASKNDSQGKKKTKPTATTSQPNVFLSFTLEQARVRKYAYAAIVYFFVIITILGPVRLYVGARALSGHEPFGWALGYLFGNIPAFRFWAVSNNLERWICLPARTSSDSTFHLPLSAESLRQDIVGPANTRLLICVYCVVVLLLGIVAVLQLTSVVEVDTRRKVFHGIMVAMLLPTIFVDPCFIALALCLVLAIFLLLDLFRASQLPPLSRPLTTFLAPYVDGRDYRGPIIVSHIFLLIGCAIPLWLSLAAAPRGGEDPSIGWETPVRDLSMVSGVVCVGMGDAAASLIGRRYGKTKWYWAGGKSLEGSLAFAFAVVCGLSMGWVWLRLGGWATWHDQSVAALVGKCVVAGLGASVLESTLTAANDNVVVPIGLWLLVRGLNI
jgi:dolichol kinase